MFDRESWVSLVPFVVVCFAAAGIGSLFTATSVKTWYAQLRRPEWTPPNWIFGPVWTTLYLLMAISAWLVWRSTSWPDARFALTLFTIQLVLNCLWSLVFFGLRKVGTSLRGDPSLVDDDCRHHGRLPACLITGGVAFDSLSRMGIVRFLS